MNRFSARKVKSFISWYLKVMPDTHEKRRDLLREVRSMGPRIRWTPHLFKTVTEVFAPEFDQRPSGAIFLARDALKLATFEDAAALVCAEAAKDPECHPLLRGRTSFTTTDCMGDFWRVGDKPALQRSIVIYLNRAVEAQLRPKGQLG